MLEANHVERLLGEARRLAEAAGISVCIAVVDAGGGLAGFLRMPGAFLISTDLAIDKAWTSAGMVMTTRQLGEALATMPSQTRDGLLRRPRLTEVPGGVPIPQRQGGIGVSGGSEGQDEEIARAALAALEEI